MHSFSATTLMNREAASAGEFHEMGSGPSVAGSWQRRGILSSSWGSDELADPADRGSVKEFHDWDGPWCVAGTRWLEMLRSDSLGKRCPSQLSRLFFCVLVGQHASATLFGDATLPQILELRGTALNSSTHTLSSSCASLPEFGGYAGIQLWRPVKADGRRRLCSLRFCDPSGWIWRCAEVSGDKDCLAVLYSPAAPA